MPRAYGLALWRFFFSRSGFFNLHADLLGVA